VREALVGESEVVSARGLLWRSQRWGLIGAVAAFAATLALAPVPALVALVALATVVYVATVAYRFFLFLRSATAEVLVVVDDEDARAVPDHLLPVYTILIPAYLEPEVISSLIAHVDALEYPKDRLDVKVLVEADDEETLEAIRRVDPGEQFEVVYIPPAQPRTKPKALNYGFSLARGDIVAVYDAEDVPDPLQLRRAAVGLSRLPEDVACLQAKLSYHNPTQNLITRWFTIEYAMWFSYFLPGLAASRAPIPLGGTSNHFRRKALRAMGAWDPFNVTEDADLGIRMYREGFTVAVLESTTYEEANSDFVNWVRQRSRWYKGYLQTFIVHLRRPREFTREVGWRGLAHFSLFVGGTPVLAFLNPVFWVLTVLWFAAHPAVIRHIFPAPVYYAALVSWALGNFLLVYLTVVSCKLNDLQEHLIAALLVPLYWVMMSMAAAKAMVQLIATPSLWEKTFHGLDTFQARGADVADGGQ
jgi:cellulose synthase/poly-beta-1,6-N-acetylglucosamine synthase-like glycosyltransferase